MNAISKGIIGAIVITVSALSHAAGPIYYTVNSGPTQQLHLNLIYDHFSGPLHISSGTFCQAICTLGVDVRMTDNLNSDTTLTMTNAGLSGSSPLCSLLSLSGFPWEGSVPHSSIPSPLAPITFSLNNAGINASLCGPCSGGLNVTFNPANGGSFELNDPPSPNCSVSASLTSPNYYEVWH